MTNCCSRNPPEARRGGRGRGRRPTICLFCFRYILRSWVGAVVGRSQCQAFGFVLRGIRGLPTGGQHRRTVINGFASPAA